MADVKWIKITTDIFDNRKIKQIEALPEGDTIIVIWVKLMCLAGTINDNGFVYITKEIPYTEQMLATQFNKSLNVVQMAFRVFQSFGMIEIIDDVVKISNWEKYQNVEGMDKIREQTRKRVAKHRELKKLECNVTSNVTVTDSNATDKNRIDKNRLEEDIYKPKRKRFVPPTVEEVKSYCEERNNNIDAEYFVDYYTTRDWILSNGKKMKDWKASVRNWERNNFNKKEPATVKDGSNYPHRDYGDFLKGFSMFDQ